MQTIMIFSDTSIDDYYERIRYSLNQRFHNYQSHFPEYPISESEYAELETFAAYAHEEYQMIDKYHVQLPDGEIVHIERLIR